MSIWSIIGVEDRWLKVLQSSTTEVGQGKGSLWFIIRVGGIVAEIEVAEEDEVVELLRVRIVKSVGLLTFGLMGGWLIFMMAEFISHEEDSLC